MKDLWLPSIAVFLIFGVAMGALFLIQTGSVGFSVAAGLASGAAFTAGILFFMFAVRRFRLFGVKESEGWAPAEVIVRSGEANIMRRGLAEGGILFLTDERLRFCGHRAGLEIADFSFPLADINSVERCRTLGIVPNGLRIALAHGRTVKFVVRSPAEWVAAIGQQSTKSVLRRTTHT